MRSWKGVCKAEGTVGTRHSPPTRCLGRGAASNHCAKAWFEPWANILLARERFACLDSGDVPEPTDEEGQILFAVVRPAFWNS